MTQDPRFPIGKFTQPDFITKEHRDGWIAEIAALPEKLRAALDGLTDEQLDTPYREGGWTVRQVAHHVPDSHMNAYIRFKWALSEEMPLIKAYDEVAWATLPDVANTPIEVSLKLLDALHARWVVLLRNMTDEDFARAFIHPEFLPDAKVLSDQTTMEEMRKGATDQPHVFLLEKVLGLYAWHGAHHTAHITMLREKMGW